MAFKFVIASIAVTFFFLLSDKNRLIRFIKWQNEMGGVASRITDKTIKYHLVTYRVMFIVSMIFAIGLFMSIFL